MIIVNMLAIKIYPLFGKVQDKRLLRNVAVFSCKQSKNCIHTYAVYQARQLPSSLRMLRSYSVLGKVHSSCLTGFPNRSARFSGFERRFQSKAGSPGEPQGPVSKVDKAVDKALKTYNLPEKSSYAVRVGFVEGYTSNENGNGARASGGVGRFLFSVFWFAFISYTLLVIISAYMDSGEKPKFRTPETKPMIDIKFKDVCGVDEAKEELHDIVAYLRNPERYTKLGAKLPKGILLVGPPGTGKTLLAKAVAGEAGVPFFYVAGSEFEEMYVGVGASRVRALFEAARQSAPAIIFIDEIDACGSARTNTTMQPYARQTINQLLQEMDGFHKNNPIVVLAATNSPEVLDKALTRPGRFDSQVQVGLPDIQGRRKTFEMYLNKLGLNQSLDNLNIDRLASLTGGMSGAEISNVVNQAALQAAKSGKGIVSQEDLEFAFDKVKMGPELRSRVRTEYELTNTAYHEAGHALVAFHTPAAWDIYKATIRQRGGALGHVSQLPGKESETGQSKEELMAQMDVAMGGRVAEELLSGSDKVTTGASSDIQAATRIAYAVVCDLGMSDKLGCMKYDLRSVSEETKRVVELEVQEMLQRSYQKAKKMLTSRKDQHKLLAEALIRYETLTMSEIRTLLNSGDPDSVQRVRDNADGGYKNQKPKIVIGPFGVPVFEYKPPSSG